MAKTGKLSINSENMLPIIKKWLYSDRDIFVREQVANACDAITKLKKLEGAGEFTAPEGNEYEVRVEVDPEEKTLSFIDNGIGMTAEEVEKYITQIAFSGASEFLKKYEGKTDADQIIGHFGLGFYSAFMVADEVHIDTLSYLEGAEAVHWESDGVSDYAIGAGERKERGTKITLFINDDCLEFCNEYKIREILGKYCSFMPTPIFVKDVSRAADKRREEDFVPEERRAESPVNDTEPLWTKRASECTDEDYKAFYRKVFNDYREPLFWIHLNTEFPFSLRGILYFPQINTEYDALEAQIKLYNNQVFIADNIKEVIPEFLMTLKGVIDCPDLPLNVSRSALQNDGTVKKICEYISKKVADKLGGMCKTDRENYEKNWDAISPFIKYGCIRDEKFADKMGGSILFKNLDGKYLTLKEYADEHGLKAGAEEKPEDASENEKPEAEKEEEKDVIYYVTDPVKQAQYISMFKSGGRDAVILKDKIDQPFIGQLEQRNEKIKFARIDSELSEELLSEEKVGEDEEKAISEAFTKALGGDGVEVKASNMKDSDVAAVITLSEEERRMQDMMKMYGMSDTSLYKGKTTLVVNAAHPLAAFVRDNGDSEAGRLVAKQVFDMARLTHEGLSQEEMTEFIKRSNKVLEMIAGK